MELRYPLFILLIISITFIFIIFQKKKKINYTIGSKIANTNYIKNTDYYQKKLRKYNIIKKIITISCIIAILSSSILISRLATVESNNLNIYNRDIFLCMDVSTSVDELNLELVENLKNTLDSLKGERIGISIFNTSSVVLSPLTDDYNYIKNILNNIKKSLEIHSPNSTYDKNSDDYLYLYYYIINGTNEGALMKGSSLIGDGLSSCAYSFSNLEEERTRIIIFSTDNDLAGKPLVTLDKAADIVKQKGIKVYGISPKEITDKNKNEFKNSVEKTGGKYYEHSLTNVSSIVNDIEKTSKTLLKDQIETKKIDIPQIPFIILLGSIIVIIILNKKVN